MPDVRFAVFTDLHYDYIPDGDSRLREMTDAIRNLNVDFAVELGDLCSPIEKNKPIVQQLVSMGKPVYRVLGNHDCNEHKKEEVLSFLGIEKSYYSFSCGWVKFLVLDACFIKNAGGSVQDYSLQGYDRKTMVYPYLPAEEIAWLEKELSDDFPYYVILSHHSLENPYGNRGVANRSEVWQKIRAAEKKGKRVLLCINGHDHINAVAMQGRTCCFTLNASSYIWISGERAHRFYPPEAHEAYPFLKNMLLYREALYAVVTVKDDGTVFVRGMEGSYRDCAPQKLGVSRWNGRKLSSRISSFRVKHGRLRYEKKR